MIRRDVPEQEPEPRLIASYKIEGTPIYDVKGHAVAVVEDLVIDAAHGDIRYALVLPNGSADLKPIPWEQLRFDSEKQSYITAASREVLEDGPSLDPDAVIDWTDESWNARVRSYYAQSNDK